VTAYFARHRSGSDVLAVGRALRMRVILGAGGSFYAREIVIPSGDGGDVALDALAGTDPVQPTRDGQARL